MQSPMLFWYSLISLPNNVGDYVGVHMCTFCHMAINSNFQLFRCQSYDFKNPSDLYEKVEANENCDSK